MTGVRLLVVGCGSAGSRHARNLALLGQNDVMVFDPVHERASALSADTGATVMRTLEEGLSASPDGVLICTPPDLHCEHGKLAVDAGADVFIEKPIAVHTGVQLDALLEQAERRQRQIMVGYNLRFNRCLQAVKEIVRSGKVGEVMTVDAKFGQYLPDWRPGTDYRAGYITRPSSEGGGIIRDVGSHELDYVTWLGGNVVGITCVSQTVSELEMESEDTAEILLQFRTGAVGRVHVDCVQRQYTRRLKISGSGGTVKWDRFAGVTVHSDLGDDPGEQIHPAVDPAEAFTLEMEHFLKVVARDAQPPVSGREATGTLRLVELALKSAASGQTVQVN